MESRQTQQRRKINDNEDEDNGAIVIDMFPKMKNQLGGVCPTQRVSLISEILSQLWLLITLNAC